MFWDHNYFLNIYQLSIFLQIIVNKSIFKFFFGDQRSKIKTENAPLGKVSDNGSLYHFFLFTDSQSITFRWILRQLENWYETTYCFHMNHWISFKFSMDFCVCSLYSKLAFYYWLDWLFHVRIAFRSLEIYNVITLSFWI